MERNANYALVGLISAILVMGLIIFVVLLAGRKFSQDYDVYDIVFQGRCGDSPGGEVHFNGIKVGDVSRIALDPQNSQLVVARSRVTSDVPIRATPTPRWNRSASPASTTSRSPPAPRPSRC